MQARKQERLPQSAVKTNSQEDAPPSLNKNNRNNDNESTATKAFQMMALMEKMRLEAELSKMVLALEKICKLETKAAVVGKNPDYQFGILNDVQSMLQRLDLPVRTVVSNKPDGSSKGNDRVDLLILNQEAQAKAKQYKYTATQPFLTKKKVKDAVIGFKNYPSHSKISWPNK